MYKISKKRKIIIIIIFIILIAFVYYVYKQNEDEDDFSYNEALTTNKVEASKESETEEKEEKKENKIVVHVAGCVANPGIVELNENSRISDAVEKAGGLTENADISKINLAYLLEDGMKIYISSHTETEEQKNMDNNNMEYVTNESGSVDLNQNVETNTKSTEKNSKKTNAKININTANQNELENLPGIGAATALKIINYRNENGKFKSIEDIKNVKGIGNSKFESIKDFIVVK